MRLLTTILLAALVAGVAPVEAAVRPSSIERAEQVAKLLPGAIPASQASLKDMRVTRPRQPVDEETTLRFVRLWAPLWHRPEVVRAHVDGSAIPAGHEEFAALGPHEQRYLIERLYDHMQDEDPAFLAATGGYSPDKAQDALRAMHIALFGMDDLASHAAGTGAGPEALTETGESIDPALDERLADMRTVSIATPPAYPVPADGVATSITAAQARDRLAAVPVAVAAPRVKTTALQPQTYVVCVQDQDASRPETCSQPTALGSPVMSGPLPGMDVTGDGIPDIAPALVFGPNVNTSNVADQDTDPLYATGPSFQWTVRRLGSTVAPMPKHVYAIVDVPSQLTPQPMRVQAGFDGRPASLSDSTTLGFALKNPVTLALDEVGFSLVLSHQSPKPGWALTLGASGGRLAAPEAGDPAGVSVQFTDANQMTSSYRGKIELAFGADASGDDVFTVRYLATAIGALVLSHERSTGEFGRLTLKDVPGRIEVTVNGTDGLVSWNASGTIGGLFLDGRLLVGDVAWEAGFSLTGVPRAWSVAFGDENVVFDAPDGIGSIGAFVTNHGTVTQVPDRGPGYTSSRATASYDDASRAFDASVQVLDLRRIVLASADGNLTAVAKLGIVPFDLYADLAYGPLRAVLDVNVRATDDTLQRTPTEITLTQQGAKTSVVADRNVTLDATLQAGWAAAIEDASTPPKVHGLSVRDGWGCAAAAVEGLPQCGPAAKAHLYLTGLPRGFESDGEAGTFKLVDYRPTDPALVVDVLLDSLRDDQGTALPRIQLLVRQAGIPTTGTDLTFGPFTSEESGGRKALKLSAYRITRTGTDEIVGLGQFSILARLGDLEGTVLLSNTPGSVELEVSSSVSDVQALNQVRVKLLPQGIDSLKIRLRHTPVGCPLGDALATCPAAAGLDLLQIPSDVVLTFGNVTVGEETIPVFAYVADPSGAPAGENPDALDVYAFVDAALYADTENFLRAKVSFGITNLGHDTLGRFSDGELRITSSPKTDAITLRVWLDVSYSTDIAADCVPACDSTVRLAYSGGSEVMDLGLPFPFPLHIPKPVHVRVGLKVDDFGFKIAAVKDLRMRFGILSRVAGDYGSFTLGWTKADIPWGLDAEVMAQADLPLVGHVERQVVYVHDAGVAPLHIGWHMFADRLGDWLDYETPIPCSLDTGDKVTLAVDMRPDPESIAVDRFTLPPAGSAERTWLVAPNPLNVIPDLIVNLAAAYIDPRGTFDFDVSCGQRTPPQIVFASDDGGNFDIYAVNANGEDVVQLTDSATADSVPAWSPDGRRIAFESTRAGVSDLYTMRADGTGVRRVTTLGDAHEPSWSPDGTQLAFSTLRHEPNIAACAFTPQPCNAEIYVVNARGSGETRITNDPQWDLQPAWSPDGSRIAFTRAGGLLEARGECFVFCGAEIYTIAPDGTDARALTDNDTLDWWPTWSPSGESIAYSGSDAGNLLRLFRMSPGGGGRTAIGTSVEAISPEYSGDGTKIAFSAVDATFGDYDVAVVSAGGGTTSYPYSSLDTDYLPDWK